MSDFRSVQGDDPGWPLNKIIAAVRATGERIEAHNQLKDGQAQAIKTRCPGPAHSANGGHRDLLFTEYQDGSVRAMCFKQDDTRPILESLGLEPEDLFRGPGDQILDDSAWEDPERPTQVAVAGRLAEWFGSEVRYHHGLGWLAWDGKRWVADRGVGVTEAMHRLRKRLLQQARAVVGNADRQERIFHAAKILESVNGRAGVRTIAESDRRLLVGDDDFDADPWLLNVANGTIDLRTGELRAHRREDLLTKLAPHPYDPKAPAPTFRAFLEQILPDESVRAFVQRQLGYGLVGVQSEHVLPIWHGSGANGKTTLAGAMQETLGDYAGETAPDLLLESKSDRHAAEIADLMGKRLMFCEETGRGTHFDESKLKRLTGGSRRLKARFMRQNWFEFTPQFELVMDTNHRPIVRGTDTGIWRRLKLVPFEVQIPSEDQDRSLGAKLAAEAPGILAWLVQGCLEWQAHGLEQPLKVTAATAEYREESDVFGSFLAERCRLGPELSCLGRSLYLAYRDWCESTGQTHPMTETAFGRTLKDRGLTRQRITEGSRWLGIDLSSNLPSDDPPPNTTMAGSEENGRFSALSVSHAHAKESTAHISENLPEPAIDPNLPYGPPAAADGVYTLVRDLSDLEKVRDNLAGARAIGLDLETTGLDPLTHRIRTCQVAGAPDHTWVIDLDRVPASGLDWLLRDRLIVGHNLKFELRFLQRHGVPVPTDIGRRIFDTQLASQVLTAGTHEKNSLEAVVQRELGVELDKAPQTSDWSAAELTEEQLRYAARDAAILLPLRDKLCEKLEEAQLVAVARLENRCLPAVAWLESNGFRLDAQGHAELATRTVEDLERAERALIEEAGETINWKSPKQLLSLFERLGVELPSTAEQTLAAVDHPVAKRLLEYRHAQKRASLYGEQFSKYIDPSTGRIHASFQQLGAATGRFSCSKPNLQQIPKDAEYRRLFAAPEGRVLIKADYNAIEVRIAAEIADDYPFLEAFQNEQDVHTLTAAQISGKSPKDVTRDERQAAKITNFGLIYGLGAKGLKEKTWSSYHVELSLEQAAEYKRKFFEAHPGLRRWQRRYSGEGFTATRTLAGRRRLQVEKFTDKLNTPVQGTGADGIKAAMALLYEFRDELGTAFLVHAVHDELVVEADEQDAERVAELLKAVMVQGMQMVLHKVPVVVETKISRNWSE